MCHLNRRAFGPAAGKRRNEAVWIFCWETFGKIFTSSNQHLGFIWFIWFLWFIKTSSNHTGITWRIFRSFWRIWVRWIQPFLTEGAGVNGCFRHQTLACCTGPGHSRPRSANTSVGRQILVIRRCESWSSATNIRNPEVHVLWSTWAKGILGQVEIVGKGSTKSPVSRVFFMLSFQLSPGSRQKESFHV